MTKNKRYEAQVDALQDARRAAARPSPVTLPPAAWGPQPMHWAAAADRPSVRAWIQWVDGPAEQLDGVALGWNDRVVNVQFTHVGGIRDTIVWRTAVSIRNDTSAPAPIPKDEHRGAS